MKTVAKHMLYYVLLAFVVVCIYAALSGHAQATETAVTASQTLTASLVDIIQQVSGSVKEGVSFLQQEIPDVVRQLLVFNLVYALTGLSIGVLLLLTIVLYWRKLCSAEPLPAPEGSRQQTIGTFWVDKNGEAEELAVVLGVALSLIASVTGICLIGANLGDALKLWLAPKVWLIEYAASLVK